MMLLGGLLVFLEWRRKIIDPVFDDQAIAESVGPDIHGDAVVR
jgi:hypothetical protein